MTDGLGGANVLVTGAAGFLGSHLCEALLDAGARVSGLDNETTGSSAAVAHLADRDDFTYRRCDVAEPLPDLPPADVVMHLASIASPVAYRRMPLETLRSGSAGTLNMVELAAKNRARFVFSSTSEVYGDPLEHPQTESYWGHVNPIGPRAVYDESKRFGEAAIVGARAAWGVDAGIVRIFNTFGPRMALDDGRAVPAFIDQAVRGVPLTVSGSGLQTRSLCYVDDTIDGLMRMAASDREGPINIGNPVEHTVLELAETIVRITGSSSSIVHGPMPPDDPQRRRPDITRARDELAWEPTVDLETGLHRTLDWYLDQRDASWAVTAPVR
ncbi:MAG: UDP-glucuronate decarboxylase [Aeromicrobium sp.]|jgi:dTDP-glucose 4,6-dehydratase|nr:UDP-glucuronate decarboxylase [Aeromicrobium sp.]